MTIRIAPLALAASLLLAPLAQAKDIKLLNASRNEPVF